MAVDLSVLDAANKKLQADLSARQTTRAFAAAVTAALHQMNPAPAPAGWVVAPPGSTGNPVTTLGYADGIVDNIQQSHVLQEDYDFPDGGGNSTVLVGSGANVVHDVTLRRFRLRKVGIGNKVSYGKHGFYLDAYNVLLEDIDVQVALPECSCLSIRFGGTHVNRALLSGSDIAIGVYDSDMGQSDQTVLVENFKGDFRGDTAIWCDGQPDPQFKPWLDLHMTFRNGDMSRVGGGGSFLKWATANLRNGSARFESCVLNGKPLTAADVPASDRVAIV